MSSHWRCSVKASVIKNKAYFTRKKLCSSLLFIKSLFFIFFVNLIKKRFQHIRAPVEDYLQTTGPDTSTGIIELLLKDFLYFDIYEFFNFFYSGQYIPVR